MVSTIVSLVSIVPFYNHLKKDSQENLTLIANNRAMAVDEFLARAKNVSLQITSRTRIREILQEYNRGDISYQELVEFSEPKLKDALSISPEAIGLVRFDQQGEPVVQIQMPISPSEWLPPLSEGSPDVVVSNPIYIEHHSYIFVSAAIRHEHMHVGTDMVLFDLTRLQTILQDTDGMGESGEACVGAFVAGEPQIFFDSTGTRTNMIVATTSPFGGALEQSIHQETGLYEHPQSTYEIVAYRHLQETDWIIVIKQDMQELYTPAYNQIGIISITMLVLLVLGIYATIHIIRPLTGRVLMHTDELEREVEEKTQALQEELHERIRTSEALTKLKNYNELILHTAGEGIFGLDNEGNTVFVNPSACEMLGFTEEELVGKPHHEMVHHSHVNGSPYSREECLINKSLQDGIARHVDNELFWCKNGTFIPVECLVNPIMENDTPIGVVVTFQDITERKQTETLLHQARKSAEDASRMKSEFLANMSHEIRTPLNAVIGMTTLLISTELSEEQQEFVSTIRTSGSALLDIINDILDFSKIEAGKMELDEQPFDLRSCIEDSLEIVATRAAEKYLDLIYTIDKETPGRLRGDESRLRQVLVNLLNNAVKFTETGEVTVSVSSNDSVSSRLPQDPSAPYEIYIAVRDTGIGIPPERLHRLFKSFSQADASTTRKYGGTGLGLAISKRLVEMMGGNMWVESQVNSGSTFHFTFLALAEPGEPHTYLNLPQPVLKGRRVLVVDDNATNRFVLARQLQLWGMYIEEAASGHDALLLLNHTSFDVGILDLHMPEMDGLMLASRIQKNQQKRTIPMILLPSMEPGREAIEAAEVSFAACLTKPVKPSYLYKTLMTIFADQQNQETKISSLNKQEIDTELAQRHPLQILVAEDNMVNQKVATRLLARMGYHADVASNGIEAIQALERQPYDVVFMDVQMPEMDGLEATRHIRSMLPQQLQPRITAMTAHALQQDRDMCLDAGMDDYISKPVQIGELIKALLRVPSKGKDAPSNHEG